MTTTPAVVHRIFMRTKDEVVTTCRRTGPSTSKLLDVTCPDCKATCINDFAHQLGCIVDWYGVSDGRSDTAESFFYTTENLGGFEGPSIYKTQADAKLAYLQDLVGKLQAFLSGEKDDRAALVARIQELERDAMTCLYRREVGEPLLRRLPRRKTALLILIDVDGLGAINTRLGMAAGDELLRNAAQAVCAELRAGDIGVRWGGDEFVCGVALDGYTYPMEIAGSMAARMQARLASLSGGAATFTWSAGVYSRESERRSFDTALQACDAEIVRAKEDRRRARGLPSKAAC